MCSPSEVIIVFIFCKGCYKMANKEEHLLRKTVLNVCMRLQNESEK